MFKNNTDILELDVPYFSANAFFKKKFGCKIIKIPVDAGFTCPNRDGTLSTDGCVFCSGKGSGDFAGDRNNSILEQFEYMKEKMNKKWKNGKYIIYFQAFTNTYAPIEKLRKIYNEAIIIDDVVGISIATRPDCISEEIICLLEEISKKVYVMIEFGLQTSKKETIDFINRCYENDVYKNSVNMLKKVNIDVVTHIIIGLPGETYNDILNSVKFAVECGTDGIKLQLLHILKGTRLEEIYNKNPFKIFTLDEYCNIICYIIQWLPKNIVIHRITGDGPKKLLIEPKWSKDKKYVLNTLNLKLKNMYSKNQNF